MGAFWFGQFAKRVIKRQFEAAEGAEAVRFSHGDFGFIVQSLDDAAGKQLLSAEAIEDQLPMLPQERAIFFIGSMRERMACRHHSSRNIPAQPTEL